MFGMIQDFIFAALPWIVMAVVIAYITASWAKKNREKSKSE